MFERLLHPAIHRNLLVLVTFTLMACVGQTALAEAAVGRVVFATGQPTAVDADGTQRALHRGDDVYVGDTLMTTSSGRLQVSFIDGGYISVQPDSKYEVEKYKYSGKQDGTESAVFRLIKGGVRAVTGLIGKKHHEAYKLHTAAATIGIRGTGFNTRICQGDCPGKKDGLYQNTWEGITYVFNNVDSVEIPAGKGVYVRNMNTPIQFLGQPPAVTAIQSTNKREQQQQNDEDQNRNNAAGDQRNNGGLQSILVGDSTLVPTPSRTFLNQNFAAVAPPDPGQREPEDMVTGTQATVFANGSGYVGILSTQHDGGDHRSLGTIDPAAVLGGDDPASVNEALSLLSGADQTQVHRFLQHPAAAVESVVNPVGIGWGRWANGQVLITDDTGHTSIKNLAGNQSVHFVFGPEPPVIPTMGTATYGFLGGTHSTSVSGATIGNGVVDGFIGVDFTNALANLYMDVSHAGNLYGVSGNLNMDAAANHITDIPQQVTAYLSPGTIGGPCNNGCATRIDGSFVGPTDSNGNPANIGIAYSIETHDPITGAAAFSTSVTPRVPIVGQ